MILGQSRHRATLITCNYANGKAPSSERGRARTPLALHWATAALASKGLGAASLLIVACDTLKDRARSACTAPSESELEMTRSTSEVAFANTASNTGRALRQ